MTNRYPWRGSQVVKQIPDNLPDYSQPIYTPTEQQNVSPAVLPSVAPEPEYYDEDPLAGVPTVDELFGDIRPSMTRSEAEEQMHLSELRRLAEGYTENDAAVISSVLAKNYPMQMFQALNDEYFNMKQVVDTVTGAVKQNEQ